MKVSFRVDNFDFVRAAAMGVEPPRMSASDSVAIFAIGAKGEDAKCVWLQVVPSWTQSTDLNVSTFKPPAPGQYCIKYRLGMYDDSVAGETLFTVKFPRKGANRFATFELETLSIQAIREARVFVSLNPTDMDQELVMVMKDIAASVQSALEDINVTCTFVCLNFRQAREESVFEHGVCGAIRKSLSEIDKCRPLFVSLLGERYGLVPQLHARDNRGIQQMYEEYPWMENLKNPFVNTALGYSMLEIELLYSVLMEVDPEGVLVYHRDLNYVQNHVLPRDRGKYLEVGCGEMKTAAARSAMADLTMRLKGVTGLEIKSYPHPDATVDLLSRDLIKLIRQQFPLSSTPTMAEKERITVEAISTAHLRMLYANVWAEITAEIDDALEEESCRMVLVTGGACVGKTALLAHWKKHHVLKYNESDDNAQIDLSSCALSDGPRADLAPHVMICTFVSHLGDTRIDSILRHVFSEIRRLTPVDLRLPLEGQCLDEFPAFMSEAAKYGVVWIIDNVHLIVGVSDWQFLSRVTTGVTIIATIDDDARHLDLVQAISPQTSSKVVSICALDAGFMWGLQQHYCQLYDVAPDDELVWKMVAMTEELGTVLNVSHARTIWMAHRLMTQEGAPWPNVDNLIQSADAAVAFVTLVQQLQQWEPVLAQIIVLTAWSHRCIHIFAHILA